jgi:NAD(P)-dependent dehydrogenase (short-subunit alcohol dehydrogenase family)
MTATRPVALVTGASSGIGKAAALALAAAGFQVIGTSRNTSRVTPGDGVTFLDLDVTSDESVVTAVEQVMERFGRLDVLVNNAGIIGPTALVTEVKREDWDETISVNLTGAFLCARAVLPHMAKRKSGKIINISSVAGHKGYPLRAPYSVSKWGMIGLSQTLAAEWGSYNIQVNTISPGPVRGERMDQVIRRRAEQSNRPIEEVTREYLDKLSLRRFVEPDHIAATAVFLAASESDSITGEVIQVSSGYGLT